MDRSICSELDNSAVALAAEESPPVVAEAESAALKKKTKKKEREKKKKAATLAAAEVKEVAEEDGKKRLPKHVREIQEALARREAAEERRKREEEERLRKEEEERKRLEEIERIAEEKRRRKREKEKEKLMKMRLEGKPVTGKQKEEQRRLEAMKKQFLGNSEIPVGGSDVAGEKRKRPIYQTKKSKPGKDVEKLVVVQSQVGEETGDEIEVKQGEGEIEDEWEAKSWDDAKPEPLVENVGSSKRVMPLEPDVKKVEGVTEVKREEVAGRDLRSPICCILGHVDTGKTKLLDYIRQTNVQEGEAGGITQQIGATYLPVENIRQRTRELKADATLKVPGLLVIDTPGHQAFANMRSRGVRFCDIAILLVDIMHGLENQTIESINLLKARGTDFIVALNKVDRLYGWKTCPNAPIKKALSKQSRDVKIEFDMRLTEIITQFKEQGLNTSLYYKNKEMRSTYNIVPTSAISGEGIPDLLLLLVQWAQKTMVDNLTFVSKVQCNVLEVKVIEGLGTTIDAVLVNGVLHEGDQIVVCGIQEPIVTSVRALLTPHPMNELQVKGSYQHHKELKAAQGIRISAQGLENAIAGTALYVVGATDVLENIKELVRQDMHEIMNRIEKSDEGVHLQASTLGSLEALAEFLKSPDVSIPISNFSIGPVHKKNVLAASAAGKRNKQYSTILAFDVKVMPDAWEIADETGVRIFISDTIYRLYNQYKVYTEKLREDKRKESAKDAVFPCILEIKPDCIFHKCDPIIMTVKILQGIAKVGTPICIQGNLIDIGRISSMKRGANQVDEAKKDQEVDIKIDGTNPEEKRKMFGRHFNTKNKLQSHISRRSIEALEENHGDTLTMEDLELLEVLKEEFKIL